MTLNKFVYTEGSIYENLGNYLKRPQSEPEFIPQAYLNYISNPKAINDGEIRHYNNKIGIRGDKDISIIKEDSTYRILFLGGSTTYGSLVEYEDSYPYILEQKLNSVVNKKKKIKKFECLNGGMGGATSAEILTHFLFKYQYLEPDLVIINTGVNDIAAYIDYNNSKYHPDYSHFRPPVKEFKTIIKNPIIKRLMGIKIFSFLYIRIFYHEYFSINFYNNELIKYNGDNIWFELEMDSVIFNKKYNAFYNNLTTLILNAKTKNIESLLVTEVIDTSLMAKEFVKPYVFGLNLNSKLLKDIAIEHSIAILELGNDEFNSSYFDEGFEDGVHLNEKGELLKAEKIFPEILKFIDL